MTLNDRLRSRLVQQRQQGQNRRASMLERSGQEVSGTTHQPHASRQ